MSRPILAFALCLSTLPAAARPSLVCRVTARVPYTTTVAPGSDSTRIFTQTATLLEERRSGAALIRHWSIVADSATQLVAVDPARGVTLVIDWSGATFAESGVGVQRRGYCRANELP